MLMAHYLGCPMLGSRTLVCRRSSISGQSRMLLPGLACTIRGSSPLLCTTRGIHLYVGAYPGTMHFGKLGTSEAESFTTSVFLVERT